MKISKLLPVFYDNNKNLSETLDGTGTPGEKNRGYGIVVIEVNNVMRFGIPLRSNLKHKHGFKTIGGKGLDYSKAVLIKNAVFIGQSFEIPHDEYVKIKDREHYITSRFQKYVERYIVLANKGNTIALQQSYRYTTLVNYHAELGITLPDAALDDD
jgi:protein AbiQ